MMNRLYSYFHTSRITLSTNSGNSAASSNSIASRNGGQFTTAVSDSVEIPPFTLRDNSENSIATAISTAATAALGSCNRHRPQENEGQLWSSPNLSNNLPVQLAYQLTNLFRQFMPVTSQENETARHIGPSLQPVTANDQSINNQFQAPGDSVAATTCQMPSSSLQPVLAID